MVPVAGAQPLQDELAGLTFEVSPESFFQVNRDAADALHQRVVELRVGERALDLYCGAGAITLRLSKSGMETLGVESDPTAIGAAKRAAERNGLTERARFETGDAGAIVEKLGQGETPFDTVVVNPPRRGCDAAVLKGIAHLKPTRLIYVSCDPKTLARDAALLADLGFPVQSVTPYDLFPHSEHVEVLAVFEPAAGR
jgi:23S rRNA (uracil1939-C5)-methyltransferase